MRNATFTLMTTADLLKVNDPNELRQYASAARDAAKALRNADPDAMDDIDEHLDSADAALRFADAIETAEHRARGGTGAPPRRGNGRLTTPDKLHRDDYFGHGGHGSTWAETFNRQGWRSRPRYSAEDIGQLDDAGFESFGSFLRAVFNTSQGKYDKRLSDLDEENVRISAAMGGSEGDKGGFLIPERFQANVLATVDSAAPWLDRRMSFQVMAGSVIWPALSDRNRSSKEVAGLALSRVHENTDLTSDEILFQQKRLDLSKAGRIVLVSNELMDDSAVGVEQVLRDVFARAVLMRQSVDFVSGTGVGEPLGIINSANTYTVAKESMQTADTIVVENVEKMRERLTPASLSRAVWLAHPGVYRQLLPLHVAGTNSDTFLYARGNGQDVADTLLGRPIFYHESAKLLGDLGDLTLFDPMSYLHVQRPISIQNSAHYKFGTDQHAFRITLRDAGMPMHASTLTDVQGYESSEFVALAERA